MTRTHGTRRGRIGAALALALASTLLPGSGDGADGDVSFDFGAAPAQDLVILQVPDQPVPALTFLETQPPAVAQAGAPGDQVLAPAELAAPTAGSLLDVLSSRDDLSTFVSAVQAVGLADALDTGGPYTVFAPTNAAFQLLPEETLETLRTDREALTQLVRRHVAGGALAATAVANQRAVTTLAGEELPVTANGAALVVADGQVVTPDLVATNGLAHLTDRVLVAEPPEPTLLEALAEAGTYTVLLDALEQTGLVPLLEGEGPYTVLAPTDQAFAALPAADREALLADPDALAQLLRGFIVRGRVLGDELAASGRLTTVGGDTLEITADGEALFVGEGAVTSLDAVAVNGVVHGLGSVYLQPPVTDEEAFITDAFGIEDVQLLAEAIADPDLVLAPAEVDPAAVTAPSGGPLAELPAAYQPLVANTQALTDALVVATTGVDAPVAGVTTVTEVATEPGVPLLIDRGEDVVALNQMLIRVTHLQGVGGVTHVIDMVTIPPGRLAAVPTSQPQLATFTSALRDQGFLSTFDPPVGVVSSYPPILTQTELIEPATTAALLGNPRILSQDVVQNLVTGEVTSARIVAFTPGLTVTPNVDVYPSSASVRVDYAMMTLGGVPATNGFVIIRDAAIVTPDVLPVIY